MMKLNNFSALWFRRRVYSLVLLACIGCGTIAGNPEDDDSVDNRAILPDARGISLVGLGQSELANLRLAAAEANCASAENLGVFGLAVGPACMTANLVPAILYGDNPDRNGDGILTCEDDYVEGADGQGLLFSLLCSPGILQTSKIKSLNFSDNNQVIAINFSDFDAQDSLEAVGHWTPTGPDAGRYPANIRAWTGASNESLRGVIGLALSDLSSGKLYFDLSELPNQPAYEITFADNAADAAACIAAPSKENCVYQEIKMKQTEDIALADGPSGLHLTIMADKKESPTFIAIEGKYRLNTFDGSLLAELANTREIYFRIIQKSQQIWGAFDFKNAQGDTIDAILPGTSINVTKTLRNGTEDIPYSGVCQNLGTDEWVECTEINYQDYVGLWQGDADFSNVLPDYALPDIFTNPPTTPGVEY